MARNKYPEETVKLILDVSLKLFMEKGYERTSIQDIIDHLGGLSKGAIYHHFKSKEEIFEGVCQKIGEENVHYYDGIRDDPSENGYEKLKIILRSAYTNPNSGAMTAMIEALMSDPKFVMNQIQEGFEVVIPHYIEPIIRQGIADGSIQTEYPRELAGVLLTLINVWINPTLERITAADMKRKMEFLQILLRGIGIDLLDDEMMAQYIQYSQRFLPNEQTQTAPGGQLQTI